MQNYILIKPDTEAIKTLYEWDTSEKNAEYIAGRVQTKVWTYEEYFEKMQIQINDKNKPYKILQTRNGDILGNIKTYNYNQNNHSIVCGFYIPEQYRSKGYGSIMLSLFIEELFLDTDLNLNKIVASTVEDNIASIKLLEKTGFIFEGKRRENIWLNNQKYDEYVYSLLRSEWENIIKNNLTTAST